MCSAQNNLMLVNKSNLVCRGRGRKNKSYFVCICIKLFKLNYFNGLHIIRMS